MPAKWPLTLSFVITRFTISFTSGSSVCTVCAASALCDLRQRSELMYYPSFAPAINQRVLA